MMAASNKIRLDQQLLALGLVDSRDKAQALIMAGKVLVDDTPISKCGHKVNHQAHVRIKQKAHDYVSRGGVKLAAALAHFRLSPNAITALDIGSSTGGFTDVLLRGRAKCVVAVDVGQGQLAWRLRNDDRVVVMERTNARHLTRGMLDEVLGAAGINGGLAIDWVVADASFISLKKVLPPSLALLRDGGWLVALIKPQFEVGKSQVGKGGIVGDPALHAQVLADISGWLGDELGWQVAGTMESPITGADGNREFFIAAQKPAAQ